MTEERSLEDDIDEMAGIWNGGYGEMQKAVAEKTGLSVTECLLFTLTYQMRDIAGKIRWIAQYLYEKESPDEPWKDDGE